MKQYCRYCVHCFEGDGYCCSAKERYMSEEQIKRANNCPDFILSEDIITGREYKPKPIKIETEELPQLSFEELGISPDYFKEESVVSAMIKTFDDTIKKQYPKQ